MDQGALGAVNRLMRASDVDTPRRAPAKGGGSLRVALLAGVVLAGYVVLLAPRMTAAAAPGGRGLADLAVWLLPVLVGVVATALLTTQARRAERARQGWAESEQRFRLAVEAARCGIWEWDLRARRVMMSDVTGVMLGWGGGGEVAADELLDRVAPEHRARVQQALRSAAGDGAFDVSFRVESGSGGGVAWVDARGHAVGETGPNGYARLIGVAVDVTHEQAAQHRAQLAENRLRDAFESASEAFVLWDRQGRLVMANDRYRDFFRLEPRVLKPGAQWRNVEALARMAVVREETPPDSPRGVRELEMTDGRWLHLTRRRTADGGLVMVGADITAVKRQEENRRRNEETLQALVNRLETSQAELAEVARKYQEEKGRAEWASKAKTDFLANMSHELRTPLNAINGFSEIMVGELFGPMGDKRYREYAADILASGQHLLTLINDILDMSKIEAGKLSLRLEPVSVEDAVEDAVRLMRNRAQAAELTLEVRVDPTLPEIEADYRALKQILLNLLSNAVKFTPSSGRVFVTATRDGGEVVLSVRDTGVGISAQDLDRLARPFEQVESQQAKTHQGTGLGLALSKSLTDLHGGRLEMESEPGVGTTVTIRLPVEQSQVPSSENARAA